ncbi:MAG: carbohydrate ABC transporter permease, partial [Candidatus Tectomicrobia bacterium]|nr:carbohydrate ABC transporter permease [Candidatus Tectomicrobia bacterium]
MRLDHEHSAQTSSLPRLMLCGLALLSLPIVLMYLWLVLASFNHDSLASFWPTRWTLQHWRFLWLPSVKPGYPNIWQVTANSVLFSLAVMLLEVSIASLAGYVLSRWQFRSRLLLLQGTLLLHAFPAIALIIAIFFVLRALHLLNTLAGVLLVKVALELPFALWVMKGFFDAIPWHVEMAALVDGAGRLTTWYRILLPQIRPGITALSLFAFLSGWGEYVFLVTFILDKSGWTLSRYVAGMLGEGEVFVDYGLLTAAGLF